MQGDKQYYERRARQEAALARTALTEAAKTRRLELVKLFEAKAASLVS